jgi:hypothetical protein
MSELAWGIASLLLVVAVDWAAWRWAWVPGADAKVDDGLVWKRGKWREARKGLREDD